MKVFVFIETVNDNFNLGMLSEEDTVDKIQLIKDIQAPQVRQIINQIPTECIFVGRNLRKGVLMKLMHQLCKLKLDLPDKLKFHWVPPYKMPLDDVDWLYNFGTYTDGFTPIHEMGSNLGIEVDLTQQCHITELAKIYFTLIGDFNKF
jgi:hypothetical protein